jgi:chemotaxis protein histidine kinase CheA
MSSSAGVLDFFIVEANEYIERLDSLIASGGASGPEPTAFARNARMLRGSATMSRREGIASVAAALERVARALGDHRLTWDPALAAAVTGSVDDLRILLRNARTWSALDDKRSADRTTELARFAPESAGPGAPPPARSNVFLAGETSELASVLDRFAAAPTADSLARALQRLRALRGVADVRDMVPVGEVMETVEDSLRPLEAHPGTSATEAQRVLARTAAAFLRRASRDIGTRGNPDPGSAELADFHGAAAAIPQHSGKGDRIVPISQLFHDDAGPHIVSAAAHPPTTAAERLRLEVVSLAEHLRGVVAEARSAAPGAPRDRSGREMRNALRALGSAAHSFGERAVARFAAEWSTRASSLDAHGLDQLDEVARLLADPSSSTADIKSGVERLTSGGDRPREAARQPSRTPLRTPTGRELHELLEDGIASFLELDETPLSPPAALDDERVVPIDELLYRGRAALERAAALRAEVLYLDTAPPREVVEELFDLIELALVE